MKTKTIVNGRLYIDDDIKAFIESRDNIKVINIHTHLASDQQIIAVIVYREV